MRSLSPSRTFTCTLTVSPDFIAGRSVSCDFSTISIAPISQLLQDLFLFIVQHGVVEQVRPPRQRPAQRLAFAPAPDRAVIPREQDVRNREFLAGLPLRASDRRRSRVLREVQQTARERILGHRSLV